MKNFLYALQGLVTALRSEKNLRFHVAVAVLVISAGFFANVTVTEWMVLILCMAFVISMELLNTAVEYVCNAVQPEHHPFIKYAKDIAAAAVLIAAVATAVCGLIIFIPKLFPSLISHNYEESIDYIDWFCPCSFCY